MKPALFRLAPTLLSFIFGCHATAVPAAAPSASPPAGAEHHALAGQVATLDSQEGAPEGYFVSPTGSATGMGTFSDPWTLAVGLAGGYPTNTVRPGDTVWLRGGTYNGRFTCSLNGAAGNEITFRSYPGERAVIDGAWSHDQPESGGEAFYMTGRSSYVCLRDVEIMDSNIRRYRSVPSEWRTEGIMMSGAHVKIINCVIHDTAQGIFVGSAGNSGAVVYGNLIYHNGMESPQGQSNCGAAIDLSPSGAYPVALSGSYSTGAGISSSATWSHNNAGDYLVVVAYPVSFSSHYSYLSATYNGVPMTLLNGSDGCQTGQGNNGPIGVFIMDDPPSGAHDVVVTFLQPNISVRCIAQSFVNVGSASAAGTWVSCQDNFPPYNIAVSSATNHMVVDGVALHYAGPGNDAYVNGDNTLITMYFSNGTLNPALAMSYAAGATTVNMGWDWTTGWYGHGHGMYMQEATGGKVISDNIVYDEIGDCTAQAYGSSSADFIGVDLKGNAFISDRNATILGGLTDFSMTDTVVEENYVWKASVNVGYRMADYTNLKVKNNYIAAGLTLGSSSPSVWDALSMSGNTITGNLGNFTQSNFPSNIYYTPPSTPITNLVVVRPNAYEANRANIVVYNWENLTTVDVDISSAVAVGTPIYIMNAQDYFNTPVYSGVYDGGAVTLPMTGLTVQAGIGDKHDGPYMVMGATGPAFNAFIVRAQAEETWRGTSDGPTRESPGRANYPLR